MPAISKKFKNAKYQDEKADPMPEANTVVHTKMPKIAKPEALDTELIEQRKQWQSKYDHYLKRANALAIKLQNKQRDPQSSERYRELMIRVRHYWTKLHESRPKYIQ